MGLMWPFKRKREPVYTGNCLVRQHTGDGDYVGRCWHPTYDGICPTHGEVSHYIGLGEWDGWPDDFAL